MDQCVLDLSAGLMKLVRHFGCHDAAEVVLAMTIVIFMDLVA